MIGKVLSTQWRCNRCGMKISEPLPATCPNCQAELTAENLYSEWKEWGRIRQRGRARFIWLRGVLPFFLMGVASALYAWKEEAHWAWILVLPLWAKVCGALFGYGFWKMAEKQYQQADESATNDKG